MLQREAIFIVISDEGVFLHRFVQRHVPVFTPSLICELCVGLKTLKLDVVVPVEVLAFPLFDDFVNGPAAFIELLDGKEFVVEESSVCRKSSFVVFSFTVLPRQVFAFYFILVSVEESLHREAVASFVDLFTVQLLLQCSECFVCFQPLRALLLEVVLDPFLIKSLPHEVGLQPRMIHSSVAFVIVQSELFMFVLELRSLWP